MVTFFAPCPTAAIPIPTATTHRQAPRKRADGRRHCKRTGLAKRTVLQRLAAIMKKGGAVSADRDLRSDDPRHAIRRPRSAWSSCAGSACTTARSPTPPSSAARWSGAIATALPADRAVLCKCRRSSGSTSNSAVGIKRSDPPHAHRTLPRAHRRAGRLRRQDLRRQRGDMHSAARSEKVSVRSIRKRAKGLSPGARK